MPRVIREPLTLLNKVPAKLEELIKIPDTKLNYSFILITALLDTYIELYTITEIYPNKYKIIRLNNTCLDYNDFRDVESDSSVKGLLEYVINQGYQVQLFGDLQHWLEYRELSRKSDLDLDSKGC